MQPKDYFKKTFVFVFTFILVYKTIVGLILNRFEGFDLYYLLKTIVVSLVTALLLAGINYYAKLDFFTKKADRKSNDN